MIHKDCQVDIHGMHIVLVINHFEYSFNQLDLPEYPAKEILHERLMVAIKETKGFGFA